MKVHKYPGTHEWETLCQRPVKNSDELEKDVRMILEAVKKQGDKALREFSKKFDGFAPVKFLISKKEIEQAEKKVSKELKQAILLAKNNIERFHASQKEKEKRVVTTSGVMCWRKGVAIERVGLYIPGGS